MKTPKSPTCLHLFSREKITQPWICRWCKKTWEIDRTRQRWRDRLVRYDRGAWVPWHWRYRSGGGGLPESWSSIVWWWR